MHSNVLTVAQPFGLPQEIRMPLGMSIYDIAKKAFGSTKGVVAFIKSPEGARQQWEVVPDDMWSRVKPHGEGCLKFEFYPTGGDITNIFLIAAAVVVSIAAPYLLPALGPAFAVGTLTNTVLSAAIAIGVNLAVSALYSAPDLSRPAQEPDKAAENAFTNVESDSNLLGQGVPAPKVLGQRRVTLPDLAKAHTYLEGGVDVVERVMGATGHTSITDIWVDGVAVESHGDNVTLEIVDGQEQAAQQILIDRITNTKNVSQALSEFSTGTDNDILTDQGTPSNAEPQEIIVSPGFDPLMEQITLRINLEPLLYQQDDTEDVRQPFRISMWPKSDPTNIIRFPEFHFVGTATTRRPKDVRIRWDGNFGKATTANDLNVEFFNVIPETNATLSDGSTGLQWEPHPSFRRGGGIADPKNVSATLDSINIRLNQGSIPRDDYEISVVLGLPVRDTLFNATDYTLDTKDNAVFTIESLFKSKDSGNGTWVIPTTDDGVFGGAAINWTVLMVEKFPVETPGIAQVAMRFRGVNAKNITALVGSFVTNYNPGTQLWDTVEITNNPAAHYRQVLRDAQTFARVSTDLNDDAEFAAWWQECEDRGYECNFVATGQSVNEVLTHLATSGFATRRFGVGYGVGYFRDRTADVPDMTFSMRDSKISIEKFFVDNPKGYRVAYDDEDNDWRLTETFINNPYGGTTLEGNIERQYPAITNKTAVTRRASFDMLQEALQDKVWRIETGPAGFNRRRDDLIGVVTDLDTDFAHGFFVRDVPTSDTIVVDRAVPADNATALSDITDLLAATDLLGAGGTSEVSILTATGLQTYTIAEVSENVIQLTTDLADTDIVGTRATVYSYSDLFRRCVVLDVERKDEEKAVIFAVDEAPEIVTELRTIFG